MKTNMKNITVQVGGMFIVIGLVLFLAGTSLLPGSWIGLILGMGLIVGVAFRAVQEERTCAPSCPVMTPTCPR